MNPTPDTIPAPADADSAGPQVISLTDTVVEIVSDAGEGVQKAGVSFATVSAKMGNGIWTVEIIPADIQPPSRDPAGASGIRIRLGTHDISNMGDKIDLIVAFNEQSLLGRLDVANFDPNCRILLENKWREHPVMEFLNSPY